MRHKWRNKLSHLHRPLIVRPYMNDRVARMFRDAQDRLHDANILARSLDKRSDSQVIIRILGFEILLKCALLLSGQEPKNSHNYKNL